MTQTPADDRSRNHGVLRTGARLLAHGAWLTTAWFVATCLLIFGTPWTAAALVALGALALVPWRWPRRLGLLGWGAVAVVGIRVPLHEYADRIDVLSARVGHGGPTALTVRDRTGVWLLNLGMAVGGTAVGFPEVALETALLAVPGPDERHFRSCFAERSPRVREAMRRQRASLPTTGTIDQPVTLSSERVGFPINASVPRVALALNPLTLGGTATWDGRAWTVDHTLRVPVDYPENAELTLFHVDGRPLVVDEGLYDALERLGWLHPYQAVWTCRRRLTAHQVATR